MSTRPARPATATDASRRHAASLLRGWLRGLGLASLAIGAWGLAAPRSFYDEFPAGVVHWVNLLPPYNEHLLTDFAGLTLANAVLLLLASRSLQPELVRATLIVQLVAAVPHFVFHALNLDGFSVADAIGQTAALSAQVGVPAALLAIAQRSGLLGPAPAGVGANPR